MRRIVSALPTVALTLAAATLLWLGLELRPDGEAERARQSRSAFVEDMRGRERKTSVGKVAGALRRAVDAERQNAEQRQRAATIALVMGAIALAGTIAAAAPHIMQMVARRPAAVRRPAPALRVG